MPVWWRLLLESIELHSIRLVNHVTDQTTVIFLLLVYCWIFFFQAGVGALIIRASQYQLG